MTPGIVVGVGHCSVDYLGLLPHYPERASAVELAEFSQQGGGGIATALATVATFGRRARFAGKISDDHFGSFILRGLRGVGVDTEHLVVEAGKVSPFSFSAVEMNTGVRTVFWSQGNVSELTSDEVDADSLLGQAAALLIDGMHPQAQLELAREARQRGVTVIFDGGHNTKCVQSMLEHCDVVVASERFATEVAASGELEHALENLRGLGPQLCVITLGHEGAVGLGPDRPSHQEPPFPVQVVDTTGAGAVYLGALTYSVLQGWPLPSVMRFSSIAAALACTRLGARAGLPSLTRVLDAWRSAPGLSLDGVPALPDDPASGHGPGPR